MNRDRRNPLDIIDLLSGRISGDDIRAQEKQGQQELVNSDRLPRDLEIYGDHRTPQELYAALGIVVTDEADDLFFNVQLPQGWHKQDTSHDMWSKVLDEKGRERLSVFYKAAFYDRKAHAHICKRYNFTSVYGDEGHILNAVSITDSGKEIHRVTFEAEKDEAYEKYRAYGEAYMNENFPDYRNVFAYWD